MSATAFVGTGGREDEETDEEEDESDEDGKEEGCAGRREASRFPSTT